MEPERLISVDGDQVFRSTSACHGFGRHALAVRAPG